MYEQQVLEKWLNQIKSGEINPEVLGFESDKEKAMKQIRQQINNLHNPSKSSK